MNAHLLLLGSVVALPGLVLTLAASSADRGVQTLPSVQRSVPSTPPRQAIMRHHYLEIGEIHEAVIRGDLPTAQAAARRLAAMAVTPDVPAALVPFIVTMRHAATRTAESSSLASAASSTADLIAQCAGCHRAAGIRPAPGPRTVPDVGGVVGHMLQHQRATDALLLGLLLPSTSEWQDGAGLLHSAELHLGELPPDRRLAREVAQAENAVHKLAAEAARASTPQQKSVVYARVITTCAQCHGLHPQVWGPRSVGP